MRLSSDVPLSAVRDYWNARPCNVRHSPKPVGTKEYFDEVEARKYFSNLTSRVSPSFHAGVTRRSWRLAVVSGPIPSTSPGTGPG